VKSLAAGKMQSIWNKSEPNTSFAAGKLRTNKLPAFVKTTAGQGIQAKANENDLIKEPMQNSGSWFRLQAFQADPENHCVRYHP